MAEKGQIYVLSINDENGNPQTVVVYNKKLKASRGAKEILKWKVFNFTANKIQVCVKNFRKLLLPNDPFEDAEPFCTGVIDPGDSDVIKSPRVRVDASTGLYTYDIEVSDKADKVIAVKKLPFRSGKGRGSVTVDPELEMDL